MSNLVSVIIPVYNGETFLQECLESVLNQSHNNLEVIVIDDGSKDNTATIIKKVQVSEPRVRYIFQKNQGVSTARNHGLSLASGQYVSFVDADDKLHPDMYKTLIQALKNDDSLIVALSENAIYKNKKLMNKRNVPAKSALYYLCQLHFPTAVWSYLFRKEALEGIFFQTSIHFYEDFHFVYRVLSRQTSVSLSSDSLYFYRKHPGNINNRPLDYKKFSALDIRDDLKSRDSVKLTKNFAAFDAEVFNVLINTFLRSENQDKVQYNGIRVKLRRRLFGLLLSRYVRFKSKVKFSLFVISYRISKTIKV